MKKIMFSLCLIAALAFGTFAAAQVDVSPNNATYTTMKAAFAAINAGTHGATPTVTVTSSYAEPDSAVLFSTNVTSCLITTSGANTITGNTNGSVIVFDAVDNVILDGRIGQTGSTRSLTVTNSNTGVNNQIVKMQNGASGNTVRYCNFNGATANGRVVNIAQSSVGTSGNNNNTIEYCQIDRGARGIQVFGTANAGNSFTNDNSTFRGNLIKNMSAIGVFIGSYVNGVLCTENEVFYDAAVLTTQTSITCIQNQGVGQVTISKNKIYGMENSGAPNATYRGSISLPVTITPLPNPATTNADYINNMISIVTNNSTAAFAGACIQTQASNTATFISANFNVLNNTLYFGGSSNVATAAAEYCYLTNVVTPVSTQTFNLVLKNNICKNMRSGGSAGAFHIAMGYDSSSNLNVDADYNLAFGGGTAANSWAAEYGSFVYPNGAIEAWKANRCFSNDEQHTAFKNVTLTSVTDLHIGGPVGGDLNGTPLAAVTTDIDGNTRNSTYPWKGADEPTTQSFKLLTLGAQLEGKTTAADVRVTLRTGGCAIVSNCNADVNGTGVFCFGDSVANGTGYYLDVTSLNHLQTVSAATQSFSAGSLSYDFRTAQTQAFGSNMGMEGSNWAFYGGDVTQDGTVDASDAALIDTDAFNFVFGCYLATDINSDGSVDATDANITDNNAFNFVGVVTPCPGPNSATVENTAPVVKTTRTNVELNAAE